jgi:anti-anti-sigma factor
MVIEVAREIDNVKIHINGNIDAEAGKQLTDTLEKIAGMTDIRHAEINLSGVQTTTSGGIGKLMNFYKLMTARRATMEVRGISDSLYSQFMEIHLDRIFPIKRL